MEYASFPVYGGSGGVLSINGSTASAQTIAGGTGISVSSAGGTTTITNTQAAGANTTLSNLTSPTAINQTLNLGSNSIVGASASAGDLTLSSTSNATKGWVRLNDASGLLVDSDPSNLLEPHLPNEAASGDVVISMDDSFGELLLAYSGFGSGSSITMMSSEGTFASPTQLSSSAGAGSINFLAYLGSGAYDNQIGVATISVQASQTHTPTTTGTQMTFETVQNGTINLHSRLELDGTGQVIVAPTTSITSGANLIWGHDGSGNIGASGANRPNNLYLAGTATIAGITTIGATSTTLQHVLNTSTATPASGVGTFTNLPTGFSGNPTGYIQITINGGTHVIPYW